jgi:uracil-DNA glycosylase family 4
MKTARKIYILKTLGVDIWLAKPNWTKLENQVATCKLCALHKTRTKTVFGVGSKKAHIMFIGEAPGANEDIQGEPFVGRAGMLLNSMLKAISLERKDIYIANILKCRPPENRNPTPQEEKLCTSYLQQQIALIKPKILVALGRIAAQFLLNSDESMSKLRGKIHNYKLDMLNKNRFSGLAQIDQKCAGYKQEIPMIVTYHPAYLLRSPSEKNKAYADFLVIKNYNKKF